MALRALAIVMVLAGAAAAQPPSATSDALRDGNAAATAGDWARVSALVGPLLTGQLPPADLAEAHRLAGLAAFFQGQRAVAEAHFVDYFKLEHDSRFDPALYPPEILQFVEQIKSKHPELRPRPTRQKRYWWLNLVPPGGQIQNGERGKAYLVGGLLGAFAVANITSYMVLRSWCTPVSGSNGDSVTCDKPGSADHSRSASSLRTLNILSGVGLIATYLYGVLDGTRGYRRQRQLEPFLMPAPNGGVVGLGGSF